MMDHKSKAFLLVMSVALTSQAHDLKAELQGLAPAGQSIRLVYAKGGAPQEDNGWGAFNTLNPTTAVYAVSSVDGIIRKIYPSGGGTGNYHCINITNDGSRVVFWNAGANQVVVVTYGGTFVRSFAPANYGANGMYDYYYDAATNTHWAILSDDNTFVKVNIDKPTDAPVTVATSAQVGNWLPSDDIGGTISDDGRYLCGDNGSGTKGILDLSSASRKFTNGKTGCHVQMRPGTPVEFSQNDGSCAANCTCDGTDEHRGPNIFNTSGTRTEFHCVSDAVKTVASGLTLAGCSFLDRADGLRWLRNRNYFSQMVYGNFGPVLWRTTDKKWIYIEHDVPCSNTTSLEAFYKNTYMGDMDGQTAASWPPESGTGTINHASKSALQAQQAGDARTYSIDGRLVVEASKTAARKGIVIRQLTNGAVARICR